jgi:hypothetical protein
MLDPARSENTGWTENEVLAQPVPTGIGTGNYCCTSPDKGGGISCKTRPPRVSTIQARTVPFKLYWQSKLSMM